MGLNVYQSQELSPGRRRSSAKARWWWLRCRPSTLRINHPGRERGERHTHEATVTMQRQQQQHNNNAQQQQTNFRCLCVEEWSSLSLFPLRTVIYCIYGVSGERERLGFWLGRKGGREMARGEEDSISRTSSSAGRYFDMCAVKKECCVHGLSFPTIFPPAIISIILPPPVPHARASQL